MKTIFSIILTMGLFLAYSSFAQKTSVTIKPEAPKRGSKITIFYNPAVSPTGLKNPASVNAEILTSVNAEPDVVSLSLTGKGGWKGAYTIPGDNETNMMIVRFVSNEAKDNNNGNYWEFPLYEKGKKPVKNSYFTLAYLHRIGDFADGFTFKNSPEIIKNNIQKELDNYPCNSAALSLKWSLLMREKKDEAIPLIKEELMNAYILNKTDEKELSALLNWFNQTGMADKGKEIKDSILRVSPKGYIAMNDKMRSVLMNPNVAPSAIEGLLTDFPDMEEQYKTIINNYLINSYIKAKEYDKADETISKSMLKNGSIYNSLAWPLIEKGENLEKAVLWAEKGIQLTRNQIENLKPQNTRKAESLKNSLGMILDTYAYGLEQLGKTDESLKAYAETFSLLDAGNESINERYIQLLAKSGKYDKVVEAAETCILKGKAGNKITDTYKEAYAKLNGSSAGAEAKIQKLNAESRENLRKELRKGMLNQPAPDFNLKDFDGNNLKLSDLKGKVVVVDFWATWCGPCKMSFPALQKVQEKYKDNPNVMILALNTWEREKSDAEKEKKVKDFIAQNKYTFKVLFDTGEVVSQYGVSGIPTKFIIDKEGKIQFKAVGFDGEQKMLSEMDAEFDLLLSN